MIKSVCATMFLVSCALLLGEDRNGETSPTTLDAARTLQLCKLLSNPKVHSGKVVDIQARITSVKEGSNIWDPDCPNLGAILIVDPSPDADPSIHELDRMMRLHGLSDHPVTASLVGVLKIENRRPSNRKVLVFTAQKARNIGQTKQRELRRYIAPR